MYFSNLVMLVFPLVFTITLGSEVTPQLVNLGNVEGKGFFVDNSLKRTWASSKAYCESFGMRLAQITSEVQYNFLKGRNNTLDFNGKHWIAGRDVRAADQFLWEGSSIRTGSQAYLKWYDFDGPYTCVKYEASSDWYNGLLSSSGCSQYTYFVLCES